MGDGHLDLLGALKKVQGPHRPELQTHDLLALERRFRPFLTGSRVYGTPTPESDTDLVVLIDQGTYVALAAQAEEVHRYLRQGCQSDGWPSLRFGNLNLICCQTLEEFVAWKQGTSRLEEVKPVTREEACAVMAEERSNAEICLRVNGIGIERDQE